MRVDGFTRSFINEGYSLAELLVVLACMAVVTTAAVPNIAHLQGIWTLWGDTRNLEASMHWGRQYAIAANTSVLFEIDESGQKYYWVDGTAGDIYSESIRHLSRDALIVASPKRSLRFYQNGNAAPAGTFTLKSGAGSYSVVVSPGGRIRIQKN